MLLFSPFYKWANGDPKKLNVLHKVTEPATDGAGIQAQIPCLQSLSTYLICNGSMNIFKVVEFDLIEKERGKWNDKQNY